MPSPQTITLDADRPEAEALAEALRMLNAGCTVVLPTETVYGLAVDPSVEGALEALYRAKGRAPDKPVARFVTGLDQVIAAGGRVSEVARCLADRFWPGPLTLVVPGTGGMTGFRVPAHAVPLALLRAHGRALAVSSANRSGQPDAVSAAQAAEALGHQVDLILDAGLAPGGIPSTVVSVEGTAWSLLREGALSVAEIRAALHTS